MAVNPLQMILAEPVTALQRGRQAGFQDRAMQRRELEEDRAIEQRNRLDELYRGITPESNREEVIQQAGQIGGMEGADRFSNYFAGLDANKQAQVKAEYEGIARQIAAIDSLPPEQQQAAYDQVSQQLPPDWQGVPWQQARGRAIAMIAPADKLFKSPESDAKVVAPGGVVFSPTQGVLYQSPNRPQAPARPQFVQIPDGTGGTISGTFDPNTNTVTTMDGRVVRMGGGPAAPSQTPTMDALAAQANQMIAQGVPPEQVDAWLQSQAQASPNVQVDRALPPLSEWGAGDERGPMTAPAGAPAPQLGRNPPKARTAPGVKDEATLRREFIAQTKEPFTVINAYNKVVSAGSDPSAAGDLSMIFAYMKMLDPNSVVRETEFANAQNAAGVPDQIRNKYNQILNGERLNPNQRADFMQQARKLATGAQQQVDRFGGRYRSLAEGYGLNPENVVFSPFDEVGGAPLDAKRQELLDRY